jgi:hypothetical protein
MVGFILRNTLSEHGSVARGVCKANGESFLESVTEIVGIEKDGQGAKFKNANGTVQKFSGDEIVSMNLWGFMPSLFGHLQTQFTEFLKKHGREEKSEFYIPLAVNELISSKRERCKILRTTDSWFGVTYREDRPLVAEGIQKLISRGDYPEKL